jgi:ABC-type transporter Mla subunit MlaD
LEPDYHVDITCSIDYSVNLPVDCVAELSHPMTVGSSSVNFKLRPVAGPAGVAPATSAPASLALLPKDGTARLVASSSDGGLIPQSVIDTLNSAGGNINAVAIELRDLFEKRSLADFDKQDPATRAANISILIQRIDRAAQGIDTIINDSKTQQQLKETVENVRDATADIKTFTKRLDEGMTNINTSVAKFGTTADQVGAAATQAGATLASLQVEVNKTSQRIGDLLASLQKSTDAIAEGKGTAGRLVNDSRLYDGLVDTVKSLKDTTDELNVLIQKWKEEGVDLRFK